MMCDLLTKENSRRSFESDASTLSKYIQRFRNGPPLSHEERSKFGEYENSDFWWVKSEKKNSLISNVNFEYPSNEREDFNRSQKAQITLPEEDHFNQSYINDFYDFDINDLQKKADDLISNSECSNDSFPAVSTDGLGSQSSIGQSENVFKNRPFTPENRSNYNSRTMSLPHSNKQADEDILQIWRARRRAENALNKKMDTHIFMDEYKKKIESQQLLRAKEIASRTPDMFHRSNGLNYITSLDSEMHYTDVDSIQRLSPTKPANCDLHETFTKESQILLNHPDENINLNPVKKEIQYETSSADSGHCSMPTTCDAHEKTNKFLHDCMKCDQSGIQSCGNTRFTNHTACGIDPARYFRNPPCAPHCYVCIPHPSSSKSKLYDERCSGSNRNYVCTAHKKNCHSYQTDLKDDRKHESCEESNYHEISDKKHDKQYISKKKENQFHNELHESVGKEGNVQYISTEKCYLDEIPEKLSSDIKITEEIGKSDHCSKSKKYSENDNLNMKNVKEKQMKASISSKAHASRENFLSKNGQIESHPNSTKETLKSTIEQVIHERMFDDSVKEGDENAHQIVAEPLLELSDEEEFSDDEVLQELRKKRLYYFKCLKEIDKRLSVKSK